MRGRPPCNLEARLWSYSGLRLATPQSQLLTPRSMLDTPQHYRARGQPELSDARRRSDIRWGLGLFIFGLVVGFIPLAHYMHGSFEPVGEAFLKNVTLWWGCAFTLAVYVAQVGGLAMIVIGLCYVVLARDGAMTSVTAAERMAPALCAGGIIAEFVGRSCRLLRGCGGLAELLL